jgi:hypothetical protein
MYLVITILIIFSFRERILLLSFQTKLYFIHKWSLLLKSVYASRTLRDESVIGLGFGHISVSEVGFAFGFNTINDNDFTTNDMQTQSKLFFCQRWIRLWWKRNLGEK